MLAAVATYRWLLEVGDKEAVCITRHIVIKTSLILLNITPTKNK